MRDTLGAENDYLFFSFLFRNSSLSNGNAPTRAALAGRARDRIASSWKQRNRLASEDGNGHQIVAYPRTANPTGTDLGLNLYSWARHGYNIKLNGYLIIDIEN
jgi:hypothetical protein